MTTWIFAGVDRRNRLAPEPLSRLVTFDFKPYSSEEFLEVAQEVMLGQVGTDLARCVPEQVVPRTKDIRQTIQVANLCDSLEGVDRFEGGPGPGCEGMTL